MLTIGAFRSSASNSPATMLIPSTYQLIPYRPNAYAGTTSPNHLQLRQTSCRPRHHDTESGNCSDLAIGSSCCFRNFVSRSARLFRLRAFVMYDHTYGTFGVLCKPYTMFSNDSRRWAPSCDPCDPRMHHQVTTRCVPVFVDQPFLGVWVSPSVSR